MTNKEVFDQICQNVVKYHTSLIIDRATKYQDERTRYYHIPFNKDGFVYYCEENNDKYIIWLSGDDFDDSYPEYGDECNPAKSDFIETLDNLVKFLRESDRMELLAYIQYVEFEDKLKSFKHILEIDQVLDNEIQLILDKETTSLDEMNIEAAINFLIQKASNDSDMSNMWERIS